ncbi:hypothetical protein VCSRO199_1844 [Vibrio cholerae]|nr:hypothetical protein VCSRO199_1844 [Vibrio cholerae]GHX03438.1 hypothetical protein VCSRO60_0811 [Vibrio cholerae]SNC55614.1 Uncharacterised protein [Vibrio cholerae]
MKNPASLKRGWVRGITLHTKLLEETERIHIVADQ